MSDYKFSRKEANKIIQCINIAHAEFDIFSDDEEKAGAIIKIVENMEAEEEDVDD